MINESTSKDSKPHIRGLVAEFVDNRQRMGSYVFTSSEIAEISPQSPNAIRAALRRLSERTRIVRPLPRHDFFVIVPHEYHSMGAPPLAWFLDPLMRFLGLQSYYVGLLTAAQWNGASHFAVQETQVVVPRQMRPIGVGREHIRFFTKTLAAETPVETRTTEDGTVRISTPEATAVDLVQYHDGAGGLNMTATVLSELSPKLRATALGSLFEQNADIVVAQRLGYLLTLVGAKQTTGVLSRIIEKRNPRTRPLDPSAHGPLGKFDPIWRLNINTKVEAGT
jgi:predicted transcriptional regulator of viral defense system